MPALEWARKGGRADTVCRRYQMSITKHKGRPRYICFHVKNDPAEPFENIGQRFDAEEARALCQEHADGREVQAK